MDRVVKRFLRVKPTIKVAVPIIRGARCSYCGGPSQAKDHFFCWSGTREPYTIPACKRCNGFLGTKRFAFLGDRMAFLFDRYSEAYRKVLPFDYRVLLGKVRGQLKRRFIWENYVQGEIMQKLKVLDELAWSFQYVACIELVNDLSTREQVAAVVGNVAVVNLVAVDFEEK